MTSFWGAGIFLVASVWRQRDDWFVSLCLCSFQHCLSTIRTNVNTVKRANNSVLWKYFWLPQPLTGNPRTPQAKFWEPLIWNNAFYFSCPIFSKSPEIKQSKIRHTHTPLFNIRSSFLPLKSPTSCTTRKRSLSSFLPCGQGCLSFRNTNLIMSLPYINLCEPLVDLLLCWG